MTTGYTETTRTSGGVRRAARRHRVVVIGAGFGGLAVAKQLRRLPVDVVVIDANNFHTFHHSCIRSPPPG